MSTRGPIDNVSNSTGMYDKYVSQIIGSAISDAHIISSIFNSMNMILEYTVRSPSAITIPTTGVIKIVPGEVIDNFN